MRRLLVVVMFALAGLGTVPGPASAATGYCAGSGVDVVVDFGDLGGGAVKGCGHGTVASSAFTSAGFPLSDNPRMGNGYVCTVSGKPANRACTGTTSYWALFVSTDHRTWTYASLGAYSQAVHNGESVAFSWQSSTGNRAPRVAPAPAAASAPTAPTAPTSASSPKASSAPGHLKSPPAGHGAEMHGSASAGATPSSASTPSATAHPRGAHASRRRSATVSPSATASSSDAAITPSASGAAPSSGTSGGSGLPWWIPVGVLVVLAGGAGALTWRRRHAG